MREKIEKVVTSLRVLAERLNTIAKEQQEYQDLPRLAGNVLEALEELREHEKLIREIF